MNFIDLFSGSGTASTLLFLSIVGIVGILIGKIKIFGIKLGIAGVLFAGLLFGHLGAYSNHEVLHFVKEFGLILFVYSNLFIRELGIVLFLACVGLSAGSHFVETIMNGGYMWMVYGALITFIPLFIIGIIARLLKLNYLSICGLLAGSTTDPPALEFANSIAPVQAQSTAYATVYPLVMFLRVLLAQVVVLLFL